MRLPLAIFVALIACDLAVGVEDEDVKTGEVITCVNVIETLLLYSVLITTNTICYSQNSNTDVRIRNCNTYFWAIK
jgi:hypothetical protein